MITTYSKFYYGIVIEDNATLLEIKEGVTTYQAFLRAGQYSPEQLEDEIARAINTTDVANIYQASVNRTTRLVTISADATFTIPVATISSGFNVLSVIGFSGADKTGASTYTGTGAVGLVYTPQFKLQDYVGFEYNKEYLNAAINESANGTSEIVSFGLVRFMSCNIKYINNYPHALGSPIIENVNGLNDAISFMDWLIDKAAVEFYPNVDSNTYYHCFLSKGSRGSKGVGYTLKELYGDAGQGYFETGKLEFRLF
jgi:hypothetical protein